MHDAPPPTQQEPLSHGLKQRHLTMLGLGGVIGAGLFVGSGAGIAVAGPGIVVSYLIAGALAMLVMRMLGEMSAAMPASGSFSVHAERALGRWAGFSVRAGSTGSCWSWSSPWRRRRRADRERLGAGRGPVGWVLMFMVVFTVSNLAAVKNFGEFEFWFAALKVGAIVLFLVLGHARRLRSAPGHRSGRADQPHRAGRLPAERLGRRRLRCARRRLRVRRPGGRHDRCRRVRRPGARGGAVRCAARSCASSSSTSARCWSS